MKRVKIDAIARVVSSESESQIQCRLMDWWRLAHKGLGVPEERLLMAFPLQGARTPRNGARMKREGLRAGTPDMFLAVGRFGLHGLWIELKKHGGKPSPEQALAIAIFREQGYSAYLCIGFEQAKNAITDYLKS